MSDMILHTYAKGYNTNTIRAFNIPNKIVLLNKSLNGLASQEQRLYQMVGESTYEGFMHKLHELFNEADDVKKALTNFKKSNLQINLGLPGNIQFVNQNITILCDPGKGVDVGSMFTALNGSTDTISFHTDIASKGLVLNFEYNAKNIKNVINALQKRQKGKGAYDPEADSLRYVNKEFRSLISNGQIGKVIINSPTGPIEITDKLQPSGQSLSKNFQYRKEDIEKAIKNNSLENAHLRQAILQSRQIIYEALKKLMNGIPDLERAFDRAWVVKMGAIDSKNIEKTLEKFTFFSKGDNLSAGVAGAVQELYTVIIAEYVNIKIGSGIYGSVAKILGNIAKGGEQPKTDVQILRKIGIQVKAYSMGNVTKNMSTNIHPDALEANLSPFGVSNIADTIVQAVFNSSNGDYHELESVLEPALTQLMNMDTGHEIEDRVCFYLVDAQFLVPGSIIIKSLLMNKQNKMKISIRTSYETHSDTYFNKDTHVSSIQPKHSKKVYKSPNFTQFFTGTDMAVTDKNEIDYNDLRTHSISIDVDFDYSFMGLSKYAIF